MIDLQVHVELLDGQTYDVQLTPGIVYRWQKSHPTLSIVEAFENNVYDALLELAWEATKTAGHTTEPVHLWVDKVRSHSFRSPKEPTSV